MRLKKLKSIVKRNRKYLDKGLDRVLGLTGTSIEIIATLLEFM